jgi:urea transport system ATP-binding protein
MLVAKQPRMLLLDEPTAGMGLRETAEIREFITRIRGDMTIIIIEHDMAFVRGIAESVSVLHRGALLAEGSVDEVAGDPRVREVYLGGDPT